MSDKVECGCRISVDPLAKWPIEMCPLHKAAPRLRDALKFMLEHREFQMQMSGLTKVPDDIVKAKAALEAAGSHD